MDSKDRMDSISEDTAVQIDNNKKKAVSPLRVLSSLKLIVDFSNSQEDTFFDFGFVKAISSLYIELTM